MNCLWMNQIFFEASPLIQWLILSWRFVVLLYFCVFVSLEFIRLAQNRILNNVVIVWKLLRMGHDLNRLYCSRIRYFLFIQLRLRTIQLMLFFYKSCSTSSHLYHRHSSHVQYPWAFCHMFSQQLVWLSLQKWEGNVSRKMEI